MFKRRKRMRFIKVIVAIIIKAFTYISHRGKAVHVPKDTRVYVDVTSGIALVGCDHVDIWREEYRVINN